MIQTSTPRFKKYPAYKDSGVEWLGAIPEHWESVRMKRLYRDHSQKNFPKAELLSVTQSQGVVPRSWVETRMVMPSGDLEAFKLIEKGDFAISLRSFEGGLEYCHYTGIISPAYTVLKKSRNDLNEKFYIYLFKSHSFISELQTSVVGIREGKNISFSELSYSFLPIPPLPEQTAIAEFLDDKTSKIDQAIGIKEQQITLLKERKQIVIHQAVTRGIRPLSEVEMKDSGVEWIGKIPAHWEVKKIKHLVIETFSGGTPSTDKTSYWDGGVPWISSVDIKSDYLYNTAREISSKGLMNSSAKMAPSGSLVFVTRSGILQHTFPLSILERDMAINQDIKCLLLSNEISSEYLLKIIKGNNDEILQEVRQQAATVESIDMTAFFNLPIPSPNIQEQKEISEYIETASQKIDTAISLKQQEIEKLKEYKRSLIDGVVTGKVRILNYDVE